MVWCMWRKRIQEKRLIMFGFDAAGKTTILYGLKTGEVVTTIPTIGFNVARPRGLVRVAAARGRRAPTFPSAPLFRGDESRRRRGLDVDSPRRRVAAALRRGSIRGVVATPRLRRG